MLSFARKKLSSDSSPPATSPQESVDVISL